MKPKIDYSLYLIAHGAERIASIENDVKQAVRGGCTLVQFRAKNFSDSEFLNAAKMIRPLRQNSACL